MFLTQEKSEDFSSNDKDFNEQFIFLNTVLQMTISYTTKL